MRVAHAKSSDPSTSPKIWNVHLNQDFINVSSLPKNTPTICLILYQFNLYVLIICGEKLVNCSLLTF